MKRALIAVALLGCGVALQGCLPVAIGAIAYSSAKSDEHKAEFHKQNIEREKAGLKPLSWDEWKIRSGGGPTPKYPEADGPPKREP